MTAELRARTMPAAQAATMKAVVQEGDGSADVLHIRNVPRPVLLTTAC